MTRFSNSFTVAVLDLPGWADYTALPNGQFIEFTTNTPGDIGMTRSTLYNWCGGDFVPDYGARGGVGYCGGGEHTVWTDSRVDGSAGQQGAYVLDCNSRLYVRKCYPTANHTGVTSAGAGASGPTTDDWGAYIDDGSPQAKHTYNGMSYMPAAWGGGASGSLMRVSHTGGISLSRPADGNGAYSPGLAATWRYDLSKAAHTSAIPAITKLTGSSTYDFGSGTPAVLNDAPAACIDLVRQGWWSTCRTGSGHGDRMVFTSKTGVVSAPQGRACSTGWMGLHHHADDDIIVRLTDDNVSYGYQPVWEVWVWQAGTSSAWVKATVNRQDISDELSPGIKAYVSLGMMHPRWSSILGCYVGFDFKYPARSTITTTIRVWKITPPPPGQRFSRTWDITWELVQAKAGTGATNFMNHTLDPSGDAGILNDVYGRLVECPSLRAFVWTRDVNKRGQLIRLRGM